jgi:hypothetical protein
MFGIKARIAREPELVRRFATPIPDIMGASYEFTI